MPRTIDQQPLERSAPPPRHGNLRPIPQLRLLSAVPTPTEGTNCTDAHQCPAVLELLVQAGLSPMEALQSATISPARFLGMSDSLGAVQPGKVADLVLLQADPLADIRNVSRVQAVIRAGVILPGPH